MAPKKISKAATGKPVAIVVQEAAGFPIVGVGASDCRLDAFEQIFRDTVTFTAVKLKLLPRTAKVAT